MPFLKQPCQVEWSDHGCLIDEPEPPSGAWTGNSFPRSAWLSEGGWLPEPRPVSLWNEEEGGQRLGRQPRVSLAAHLASAGSGLPAPLERGSSSAVYLPLLNAVLRPPHLIHLAIPAGGIFLKASYNFTFVLRKGLSSNML